MPLTVKRRLAMELSKYRVMFRFFVIAVCISVMFKEEFNVNEERRSEDRIKSCGVWM